MSFVSRLKASLSWRAKRVLSAPGRTLSYVFATPYHDLFLERYSHKTKGEVPEGTRVCIYTIYPVVGVQTSHLDTLSAAVALGYGPIVVSNLRLTDSDRALIKPLSTQIIERQNFGYDFGAFRTGIKTVKARATTIEDLVLINDSIWFPVGSNNWLREVTGAKTDLAAAVSNYGIRVAPPVETDGLVGWDYDTSMSRLHYCSFALRIGPAILRDAGFWRFWERFRLTDDKIETIQRGEVGFSRWVIENNFSHSMTYPIDQLFKLLLDKDGVALREVAENLVIPEDSGLRQKRDLIVQNLETSDNAVRNFILETIAQTGPAYAAPVLAIDQLGVSFLKKSPLWLDEAGAAVTLSILREHCPDDYLSEAQALRKMKNG